MKNKYFPFMLLATLLGGLSAVLIIHRSNDHRECTTEIRYSINSSGERMKVSSHLCNEKFSF